VTQLTGVMDEALDTIAEGEEEEE